MEFKFQKRYLTTGDVIRGTPMRWWFSGDYAAVLGKFKTEKEPYYEFELLLDVGGHHDFGSHYINISPKIISRDSTRLLILANTIFLALRPLKASACRWRVYNRIKPALEQFGWKEAEHRKIWNICRSIFRVSRQPNWNLDRAKRAVLIGRSQ